MCECPDCHGAKFVTGYACPGFLAIRHGCLTCRGTGQMTEEQYNCIMAGRVMRGSRVRERMETQAEAAQRLGIDAWTLRKLEQGDVETWRQLSAKIRAGEILSAPIFECKDKDVS